MTATLEAKFKEHKDDLINLLILLSFATILGVYLITTSVLIARDGVYYIERAQKLSHDTVYVIKSHPPGYPFLIFIAHKFVMLFNKNSSAFSWAYTAQSVTLLCRLLTLIPLYFIGKLLVGSKNSFWGLLILIVLPYPAKIGSDALRDWPYILFLATGFLLLLWGIKTGKWWQFALVGLIAGLGYWIRPICMQLVLYTFVVVIVILFRIRKKITPSNMMWKIILLIAFSTILLVLYSKSDDSFLAIKVNRTIKTLMSPAQSNTKAIGFGITVTNIAKSLWHIMRIIVENLMWFFVPALCVGFYHHFKYNTAIGERTLLIVFISTNILLLIIRYGSGQTALSRRYALPMIAITIFYVPTGLHIIGKWLNNKFSKIPLQTISPPKINFFVLLVIGIAICTPKLIRPIRIEKKGYLIAAGWLRKNTFKEDIIAVADRRISFYAERKRCSHESISPKVSYIVKKIGSEKEEDDFSVAIHKKIVIWIDEQKKKGRFVIYKVI